jgi:hypothetical protein
MQPHIRIVRQKQRPLRRDLVPFPLTSIILYADLCILIPQRLLI